MSIRLSNKELEYIYNEYVNNYKTTTIIAKEIGRSQSCVERNLRKMGVDISMQCLMLKSKIPKAEHENICTMYINGSTAEEIGKIYGVTGNTIYKILNKYNIPIRKGCRRSIIKNHDIFNIIDNNEKAYWLGWMITDGSIICNRNRKNRSNVISFQLKACDKYIVENFANFVGADISKVHINKKGTMAYFSFASEKMSLDLSKYGVVPNKTGIQFMPTIKNEFMPFLLRGIFEGNGSIYKTKSGYLSCAFYGSYQLIDDIVELLQSQDIFERHKVTNRGVIASYHIGNKNSISKLFDYMYGDITNDKLICYRKYNKFL